MSSPPRRVLVVEDEPQVAVMLQDFLVDLGHDVLIAPNGADALRCSLGITRMSSSWI